MLPTREKTRIGSKDVIATLSTQSLALIKELFGIEITLSEIKTFAEHKDNDCYEDVISLAEHICLVFMEAVQNRQAAIFGMRNKLRAQIARVVEVTEPTAFEGSYIPQKKSDPRLYGLAVKFLNEKF